MCKDYLERDIYLGIGENEAPSGQLINTQNGEFGMAREE